MSEFLSPIAFQLGIGCFGGFLVGYVLKKVVKIALILGAFVLVIIYLAYRNVIDVNYDDLLKSISGYAGSAWEFLTPLLSNLPFVGSFILGLVLGLKIG